MKRWIVCSITLALLLFGSVIGFGFFKQHMIAKAIASMPQKLVPVVAENVELQEWQPSLSAIGFIEPVRGVELAVAESGLVDKIQFDSGAVVKQGQLLLELDLNVERANLKQAKAQLPALKSTYERSRKLYSRNLESKENLDNAESSYRSILAHIESLEASIKRRRLEAPFSGVMGLREVNPGQYLQGGTRISLLEDTSAMRVRFTVAQKYFRELKVGMPVGIRTDAWPERVFAGEINTIEPVVDKESGVINVQAEIPNPDNALRSGMFADIDVYLPKIKDAVVIPQQAVSFSLYGASVFVIQPEQGEQPAHVIRRDLNIGERKGDDALVLAGLKSGEQIVTAGQINLQNNTPVRLVEERFIEKDGEIPKD